MADKFALDKYADKDSLIHSWHPKCKIIGISLLIFSFAFIQDITLIPVMLGITFIFYYISKLPLSFLVSRLRYPGLFLLGMIILLPFMRGENIIWQWSFLKLRQEGTLLVLV
ncbi:MAG: CbiQ family ECF transporter T component, partial [Cyanobacteria bacterium J06636_27]